MTRLERLCERVDAMLTTCEDEHERRRAVAHLYGVAQACALLALRRGVSPELAATAGMLHDVASYVTGDARDHARRGADMARGILAATGAYTDAEIDAVCAAIERHSDKGGSYAPLDEVLIDADVMQHVLHDPSREAAAHEAPRWARLTRELGLRCL